MDASKQAQVQTLVESFQGFVLGNLLHSIPEVGAPFTLEKVWPVARSTALRACDAYQLKFVSVTLGQAHDSNLIEMGCIVKVERLEATLKIDVQARMTPNSPLP